MTTQQALTIKDLPCSETVLKRLDALADIILEWNEKINVTAVRDRAEFIEKNVTDSLGCIGAEGFSSAKTVLDMGTGGGFPGLPLAIVFPEKHFILVDSVKKKLNVVADTVQRLGLQNVEVIHARAEDLAFEPLHRQKYDAVVSRAVANMSTLCEYCLPFVRKGGVFLAYKTAEAAEEISAASNAITLLGGTYVSNTPDGFGINGHTICVISKTSDTPSKYPRRSGLPSEKPL